MHVYIHVPFCGRRCSYCDFAIAVRRQVPAADFVDAVLREWEARRKHPAWAASPSVETLYFGGGTPSRLPASAVARLLGTIAADRPLAAGAEVTLEANPEDVSPDAAGAWRAAGITRLSLGAQSLDDRVLARMQRTHHSPAILPAVRHASAAGFDNVSLDLIFALPPELGRDWSRDLRRAIALEPEHLSLYGLTTEPRTPLARWTERGSVRGADDGCYAGEYLTAHAALREADYEHYEVSNAARRGLQSRHNFGYWAGAPYLGLGPSAHSFAGGERWWNLREWAAYARALQTGGEWVSGREALDEASARLEALYLGLRTAEGVPRSTIPGTVARQWIKSGWATLRDERVRLTVEGWLRLDALVAAI